MPPASTTTFAARPGTTTTAINGNAVVLSLTAGTLYGLNPVAESIWQWLQQPRTISQLIELLTAEYEVSAEVAAADIQTLLHDLRAKDLLTVTETTDG